MTYMYGSAKLHLNVRDVSEYCSLSVSQMCLGIPGVFRYSRGFQVSHPSPSYRRVHLVASLLRDWSKVLALVSQEVTNKLLAYDTYNRYIGFVSALLFLFQLCCCTFFKTWSNHLSRPLSSRLQSTMWNT